MDINILLHQNKVIFKLIAYLLQTLWRIDPHAERDWRAVKSYNWNLQPCLLASSNHGKHFALPWSPPRPLVAVTAVPEVDPQEDPPGGGASSTSGPSLAYPLVQALCLLLVGSQLLLPLFHVGSGLQQRRSQFGIVSFEGSQFSLPVFADRWARINKKFNPLHGILLLWLDSSIELYYHMVGYLGMFLRTSPKHWQQQILLLEKTWQVKKISKYQE